VIPAQRTGRHDNAEPPYTPATLAAAIAGDREAFAELWQAHRDFVFTYAYRRLPDYATAEDIASEVFVRALRCIGTFGEARGGGFPGWLTTITRNLIADRAKSSRHRREICTGELFDGDQVEYCLEDDVLLRLQDAAVRQAVARLNDLQRACIEARFLRGLNVAETARELGRNESAVKTLQYRAVRTLANLIATDPALADTGAR
jgi:RNA polymerase sigma-70 factor, ECF subfamily